MKVLVTGAKGFVGKNLISILKTQENIEILEYDLNNTLEDLKSYTKNCDFVFHFAGVNRPTKSEEFYEGNAGFTETICKYLKLNNNKSPILISSSIQAENDNDYGKSKKDGENLLLDFAKENCSEVYIYRFANLFGKWCKPNYNSVVATWCKNIACGLDIQINDPTISLSLCYIDDVINEMISAMNGKPTKRGDAFVVNPVYEITLGNLAKKIKSFKEIRTTLQIPYMGDELEKKLYSTYLSYLPKNDFSYPLLMHEDHRGSFTEFLKTSNYGQISVNISHPGITKGNHWHQSKNEKFLVVSGKGVIQFRKVNDDEVIEYFVSGDKLEVIDIPTGYTHNIKNIGEKDMVTIMWANETYDSNFPDTFSEEV